MNDLQKRLIGIGGAILLAILAVIGGANKVEETVMGAGDAFQSQSISLIGTTSTPSTLTSAYGGTSSTAIRVRGYPNISLVGSYTPKSYGSAIYILLERSIDNGASFQPYSVLVPGTTQVPVYADGASSTSGIPFLIPGAGTGSAASGTAIGFSFDVSLAADRMRVSVKESTTSTYGTLNLQGLVSSN